MDSAIPSAPLASHSESDWERFGRADLLDSRNWLFRRMEEVDEAGSSGRRISEDRRATHSLYAVPVCG